MPNEASLTGRNDIIADTILVDKVLANKYKILNNTEDDIDIDDIYVHYDDIAQSYQETVQIGGGLFYNKIRFHEEDVTDWKIPGLYSLLEYLNNNYELKNTTSSNNNKNKSVTIFNNELNNNYVKKYNNISLKKNSYFNQDIHTNVQKKNIHNNYSVRRVPIMINIENNYYYIKKNSNKISQLEAEINNIKSVLNI